MNTGIQDAYNLGWKLAMVVQGHADTSLLDSYSAERVPVGEALLSSTRVATHLIQLRNMMQAALLPVVFGIVRNLPPLKSRIERKIMGGMSALGLCYSQSPLTAPGGAERGPVPRPGERLCRADEEAARTPGWSELLRELRDPRWTLLVFPVEPVSADPPVAMAGVFAQANYAWLSVRTVSSAPSRTGPDPTAPVPLADPDGRLRADLGATAGGWLLVRPDGYVSARGDTLDAGALSVVPRPARARVEVG
jgi:NADPH-dependent dioxygenase